MKFSHKFMRSIKILFELFLAMIFMKIIGKKYTQVSDLDFEVEFIA